MAKSINQDTPWDTDFMISQATSLRSVVKELDRTGSTSSQADPLLFSGVIFANPVLLSFAIELALKTWQYREQNRRADDGPDRNHDLLTLFDSLAPETRDLLEERMRAVESSSIEHRLDGKRSWEPLRGLLDSHKNTFLESRYLNESLNKFVRVEVQTASLDRALTVIIDAYEKQWGASR